MAVEFTPDQQQAISLHGCDILVSAAAGSGKTAVLSERIVQMVCRKEDPVDIDRLLVVTFTNAAAAEMRERISQAILTKLNEDGENEHLQKQAALLHKAQITTIDSFCLFVLRNHFQDIGLDPAFRVADEGEMELMRQDVLAELLEESFAKGEERFFSCVEYFCPGGKESVLEEHIFDLYRYACTNPFPEEWLEARKQDYKAESKEEVEGSDWGQYLLVHIRRMLEALCRELETVKALCEEPDGPYMYGEFVEKEWEQLCRIKEAFSLSDISERLAGLEFGRLPSKKDESVSPAKRERAKALRESVKESIKKLIASYFSNPMEVVLARSVACREAVEVLVELTLALKERLDVRKREKKLLDFSDMEHYALQILVHKEDGQILPTKTALEYQEYFKEVLIDEYQDSNLVQEYLLYAVSGQERSRNRFMVGDVKQSIYKFRLARPELFLEKYNSYHTEEGEERRIDLHQNFRSRSEVIDMVNTVFKGLMTKELGGIVYDDAAALYKGASYPENPGCESELLLFAKPDGEEEQSAKETEARGIAARIKGLRKGFLVTDKETGQLRPVRYRDIVILLRSGSGWDEEFKAVLEEEGIPVHISGKTGYFAAKEIQDVLQFFKVLNNPLQDIPLFGVLKSVFGGFSDEEAAKIRSFVAHHAAPEDFEADRMSSLYDCLCAYAGDQAKEEKEDVQRDSELKNKACYFLEQLEKYRKYATYMPIQELLQTLFAEYDYLPYVSALPAGGKRLANVEMLLTKAAAFEKNSYYGLFSFVRYVEQLEKYNVDFGEANTLDENADVVRIMSIHKSKGLEFPVAIVAGLSKRFNMQDTSQALLVDMDLGLGVDYVNTNLRLKSKTLRKNVLAAKLRAENLAEELRILYVAMTRAKEKLILTGCVKLPNEGGREALAEELSLSRQEGMNYLRLLEASCFLDYLLPVFPAADIQILEEQPGGEFKEVIAGQTRRLQLEQEAKLASGEEKAELKTRFSYVYPHEELLNLYTKTTVSELKKAALLGDEEEPAQELFPQPEVHPYIPDFISGKEEITGTLRGSAMHRLMELLDFERSYENEKELSEVMVSLQESGRLTDAYAGAIRTEKILQFLNSPIAHRMRTAAAMGRLHREQPFVYGIDASRLSSPGNRFPKEETVLIQGIVDAYFEEEDGLVLLDYKTDVIKAPEELVRRYKVQLDYYQEALESLVGKPVKERILYSFYLGCAVPVL